MASIDKAAIVFSIAITLVGVGIAAMGGIADNSPAAPSQQMNSPIDTDAAEKAAAEKAAAKAEAAKAAAEKAWTLAASLLADPKINFLMLDELTYMFNHGWLNLDMVTEAISQRPAHMNLVITGRGAPDGLIAACDTVSEIKDIKHAFRNGIKAQRGIEF